MGHKISIRYQLILAKLKELNPEKEEEDDKYASPEWNNLLEFL